MGRPKLLDPKLVEKIAIKLNKPRKNIVKSVCAMAHRKGITSESALILFAKNNNIGTAVARRKLSPEKQGEIRSFPITTVITTSRRGKIATKMVDVGSDYRDPFLAASVYSSLPTISMEAYQILFILENSLRSFIERVLSNKYGDSWWKKISAKKATLKIATEVEHRKTTEAENWHHAKRGVHEIYYTDYPHLLQFIRSFDSEFSSFFKKVPAKNLPGKLAELIPTRHIIAHNNPITKNDLRRLQVHAMDWIRYMQYLNKQK